MPDNFLSIFCFIIIYRFLLRTGLNQQIWANSCIISLELHLYTLKSIETNGPIIVAVSTRIHLLLVHIFYNELFETKNIINYF